MLNKVQRSQTCRFPRDVGVNLGSLGRSDVPGDSSAADFHNFNQLASRACRSRSEPWCRKANITHNQSSFYIARCAWEGEGVLSEVSQKKRGVRWNYLISPESVIVFWIAWRTEVELVKSA
jgi:hypothetical protein